MGMKWDFGYKIENNYEIRDIKQGGFGIVYLCYDHQNEKPIAIKTFQSKYLNSRKSRDDFTKEALTWIRLDKHKNIAKAYCVREIDDHLCALVECVGGGDLGDWLYTKKLDLPLILNLAIQFCNGMEYSYMKMGLIHRDIKPGNILITQDKTVKITDFGLAKTLELESEEITVPSDLSYIPSGIAGTYPYMAPEQFTGQNIDTRTDIYSFGIVLYQMVTNSYPYSNKYSWKEMHQKESPIPIKQNIPDEIKIIIAKCLEKEPHKRFQNFSELKMELSKIYFDLTGEMIIEESPSELESWELTNKAGSLCTLKMYKESIVYCEKALEINSKYADAWVIKGVALNYLSEYQEAILYFNRALEINPNNNEAWVNKGNSLEKSGNHIEAVACYDKAIDIDPKDYVSWNNKGNMLFNLGEHPEEAITYFDKALEINPRYAEAWVNKGNTLGLKMGKFQDALACYDKAFEKKPQFVYKILLNKGLILHKLGKLQEEIDCYSEALKINPSYAKAWYLKGQTQIELSLFKEALLSYQKYIDFAQLQEVSSIKNPQWKIRLLIRLLKLVSIFSK